MTADRGSNRDSSARTPKKDAQEGYDADELHALLGGDGAHPSLDGRYHAEHSADEVLDMLELEMEPLDDDPGLQPAPGQAPSSSFSIDIDIDVDFDDDDDIDMRAPEPPRTVVTRARPSAQDQTARAPAPPPPSHTTAGLPMRMMELGAPAPNMEIGPEAPTPAQPVPRVTHTPANNATLQGLPAPNLPAPNLPPPRSASQRTQPGLPAPNLPPPAAAPPSAPPVRSPTQRTQLGLPNPNLSPAPSKLKPISSPAIPIKSGALPPLQPPPANPSSSAIRARMSSLEQKLAEARGALEDSEQARTYLIGKLRDVNIKASQANLAAIPRPRPPEDREAMRREIEAELRPQLEAQLRSALRAELEESIRESVLDELDQDLENIEAEHRQQLQTFQDAVAETDALLETRDAELGALRDDFHALQDVHKGLQDEHAEVISARDQLQHDNARLRDDLRAQPDAESALRAQLEQVERNSAAQGEAHASLQREHATLQAEHEALQNAYAALQAEHQQLQARFQGQSDHAAQIDTLQTSLREARDEIQALEDALMGAEDALHEAQRSVNTLPPQAPAEDPAQLRALEHQLGQLQINRDDLATRYAELEAKHVALTEEHAQAQAQIETLHHEHRALLDLQRNLQANYDQLQDEHDDLRDTLHDTQKAKSEGPGPEAQAQIEALNGYIDQLEEANAQAQAQLQEAQFIQNEHEDLARAYEDLQNAHFERGAQLMNTLADGERIRANLANIAQELSTAREETQALREHAQALEANPPAPEPSALDGAMFEQLDTLQSQLRERDALTQELREELEHARAQALQQQQLQADQIQNLERQLSAAPQHPPVDLEAIVTELERAQERVRQLEQIQADLRASREETKRSFQALREELQATREELQTALQARRQSDERREHIQQRANEQRVQLAQLQQEAQALRERVAERQVQFDDAQLSLKNTRIDLKQARNQLNTTRERVDQYLMRLEGIDSLSQEIQELRRDINISRTSMTLQALSSPGIQPSPGAVDDPGSGFGTHRSNPTGHFGATHPDDDLDFDLSYDDDEDQISNDIDFPSDFAPDFDGGGGSNAPAPSFNDVSGFHAQNISLDPNLSGFRSHDISSNPFDHSDLSLGGYDNYDQNNALDDDHFSLDFDDPNPPGNPNAVRFGEAQDISQHNALTHIPDDSPRRPPARSMLNEVDTRRKPQEPQGAFDDLDLDGLDDLDDLAHQRGMTPPESQPMLLTEEVPSKVSAEIDALFDRPLVMGEATPGLELPEAGEENAISSAPFAPSQRSSAPPRGAGVAGGGVNKRRKRRGSPAFGDRANTPIVSAELPPGPAFSDPFDELRARQLLYRCPTADYGKLRQANPRAAFIVGQADGTITVQDLIDLSGMNVTEAATIVLDLLNSGALRV